MKAGRLVELVLGLDSADASAASLLDPTDSLIPDRTQSGKLIATITSGVLSEESFDVHLARLLVRARPLLESSVGTRWTPDWCILRLVQYSRHSDEVGPGFTLPHEWVTALGKLGGELDVDLYCV